MTGVYAHVRHPMYLGSMLFLLGFFLTTLSLLSLLMWAGLFIFLDRMATYEERDLYRIVGERYLHYKRRSQNGSRTEGALSLRPPEVFHDSLLEGNL